MNNYRTYLITRRSFAALMAMMLLCLAPLAAQKKYGYKVVHSYPHDNTAYTQGLFFHNGILYESTGLYGQSSIRKVNIERGEIIDSKPLERRYFGEGAAMLNGLLYQLTWREGLCFVYDAQTLALQYQLRYAGEGWGLTTDGKQMIMSDGSHTIRFLSPQTFKEERQINVRSSTGYVSQLNELEMVEGELWANIYTTNFIARIDTATGKVLGMIDLTGILPTPLRTRTTDVLNGIAYDATHKRIFVTGKNWKQLYEIEVVEKSTK
jgi:glutamine cyclotransferase